MDSPAEGFFHEASDVLLRDRLAFTHALNQDFLASWKAIRT